MVPTSSPPKAEPGIDLESLFKQLGFDPHSDGQWEYCRSKDRFNIPCCGRRWGKSISAGRRMTYKSFVPESYNWIVGPVYKLGEKEFRVVYRDYEKLGLMKYCKKSYSVGQGDMRIETPWKSVIEVVSADKPDSLVGEGLSHVIMSEAAKHSRSTWEQYIEPGLSDLLGSADFPSTPQGFNWYHGLWTLGQQINKNYKSWRFPSWDNPVRYPGGFQNEEIQRLYKLASNTYFRQEYGAEFTAITGSIFEEWNAEVHVLNDYVYNPDWDNYLAFDYGFANPFVALDIQVAPDESVYVWREYQESYRATHEHGEILKQRENPQGYSITGRWGDPRGADEAATLALTLGFVASFDVPWKHGVEAIKQLLKARKLYISKNCSNLIRQMSQLHVKPSARQSSNDLIEMATNGTTNIQHKVDDHGPDALRYFIGPMFVGGMSSHLEDIYGENYVGSESQDFLLTATDGAFTMSDGLESLTLGRRF